MSSTKLYTDVAEDGEAPANKQGKKLLISDEYFQRVTRALVMRLRQHEETVQQEGKSIICFMKLWRQIQTNLGNEPLDLFMFQMKDYIV